jgi:hypothetical protein
MLIKAEEVLEKHGYVVISAILTRAAYPSHVA